MIKKSAIFIFIGTVCISLSACNSKNEMTTIEETSTIREVSSEVTEESSKEAEEPVRERVVLAGDDIPVIDITSSNEIDKEYVEGTISVKDVTGTYSDINDMNITVKVRGNTTATGRKKPYNIKFAEKTDILGLGGSKKWCLLANMFDPTLLRNKLAFDFAEKVGVKYTSHYEYVEVYVNGTDMGMYMLCTPVSEGKDKVDLDLKNGDCLLQLSPGEYYTDKQIIKTAAGLGLSYEDGEEANIEKAKEIVDNFEASVGYGVGAMEKYADVDSFVNYYVLSVLFKDVDFATSSAYYYIKDGKLYAGPVWDYDLSMGNVNKEMYSDYYTEDDTEKGAAGMYCESYWYYYLMQIPEFKQKVIDRYTEMQSDIQNLGSEIDSFIEAYAANIEHNNSLWEVSRQNYMGERVPEVTYEENITFLKEWLNSRNEWIKAQWGIG